MGASTGKSDLVARLEAKEKAGIIQRNTRQKNTGTREQSISASTGKSDLVARLEAKEKAGIIQRKQSFIPKPTFGSQTLSAVRTFAARQDAQNTYGQYLNAYLKKNGSKREGKFGQYTNDNMSAMSYANHELFMSTFNIDKLEKQIDELEKEYEKARLTEANNGGEVKYKQQIKELKAQLKEYELDKGAAEAFFNMAKEQKAAEDARKKAQGAGLNSMDWYDQSKAKYDEYQPQLDELYAQRRKLNAAAETEDYSGWASDALSAANINAAGITGEKYKAEIADVEGQIIRLIYQQDEAKKQLGYASRYRWDDVNTGDPYAVAKGKAIYGAQNRAWNEEYDETMNTLSSLGNAGAMAMPIASLSANKGYKEPTAEWTDEQRNTYYALLGSGSTERADEFAISTNNFIQKQKNQTMADAIGESATSSFGAGALHTVGSIGAGLASGIEYLGDVNELAARGIITEKEFGLADYSNAVTGSISTYLNNRYGTLGEEAGFLAGKGLGDAYQIAQSIGQSWLAMGLSGGSSVAVNAMFFGQAAKQTLDEQLEKGADPYKAVAMGTLSGLAEVMGETFSLENIKGLQAGESRGIIRDILRSAGIEGSEEGVTTLLNTFADQIVNGNDSDYYVALEGYISQGMSYADAERAAMKDWLNGIAYDMISGAASGGISGGVGGPAIRAVDSVISERQAFEGDRQGLLDKAAEFKDTKAADLAKKYSGKKSITNRQAGKLGKAIEKATEAQNEKNIHNAISAELKARGVSANTGDISDAIQKSASGRMLTREEHELIRDTPGAREIRDELYERMENGKLDSERLLEEDTPQWLRSIEQKNGAEIAGQAMFGALQNEAAEQRLTEAARIETINPEVSIGEVSGKLSGIRSSGKTAEITITGEDGTQSSVNLEEAISSGAIPNDVAYLARSAAAFGSSANEVYNLYSPTQTAREYIAAMDAAINTVAANVGSRSAFEKADSVQYLTKEQRDFAWSQGQQKRTQAQEKTEERQSQSKKKTPPRKGRVSYGGVTYEGRSFKATSAEKVKPEVRRVLEKFSAATGVDIVFYESTENQRGDYVGANGFYRDGTVYLDVHAGAKNSTEKEAVLLTAAHEFTHFIAENTPRRYNQLKEFVTEHLLENGYDFETLVERKIKSAQKDGGLSRDAAVEEVVADACEMVFSDSKAVEKLAQEKPGLAKRIADWLHEFFDDIRKAFAGVEARHEEAKAMLDAMDELTKLWDDALVEAAENRGGKKNSGTKFSNDGRKDGNVIIETGPSAKNADKRTTAYVLSEHIKDIDSMDPVSNLTGKEFNDRSKNLPEQIAEFFKSVGGKVEKKGLGTVILGEYGVGGIMNHKPINRVKMVTLASVPDVIRDGRMINYDPNWKGRGYPSLIIAAPVNISGKTVYVAAVIDQREGYKFYLNECVDSEGNYIRIREDPSDNTKSGVTVQDGVTRGSEGSSENSIRNSEQNVKKSRRDNEEDLQKKYPRLDLNEDITDMDGVPAIELTDGSILPIKDRDRYPTHVSFIEGNRIDVDDLQSGGWIGNGVYDPSYTSDTDRYIERQQAKKRVAERAGKPYQQFRYSLRDSAEGLTKEEARAQAAAYTRLKAENAELQRRLEYWKGQTQRTKQATVRQTDVNRYARALLRSFDSTAEQSYIRQALQEMGDYLVQNTVETLDYEELRQMATTVAAELVATAEVTAERGYDDDAAQEILSTLKNMEIYLDRGYLSDLPEGFRKNYRGKLHVSTEKGRSVDSIYAEMQESYGYDLFPAIDNPAEQLVMMGEAYDRLSAEPEVYNPFRGSENEATLSIANEIIDTMLSEDILQTPPTMRDKAEAKLAAAKADKRQALDKLRADKDARIQEIRRQEALRRQEIRAKEKAEKWKKVEAVKAYYQNQQKEAAEKRRENAAAKKYLDRVIDKAETITSLLRKNTDKEHVPEALKEPLLEFLNSLDLRSRQQLRGNGPTNRDIRYTESLQKIRDILQNQSKYMNGQEGIDALDAYLDIPDGFDESIRLHIESVKGILSGTDLNLSGPVVMMNAEQLEDLDFILTVLTNSIKKINQYITESRFASVIESSHESREYMKELGKTRDRSRAGDNATKFMVWSNTLPYYAFKRFGAAGSERFRAIMNGWGKMAMNAQKTIEFTKETYSGEEAKRWEEKVRTIDLSDGTQVKMTDAQIMGLWCLARREQGLGHLLIGGMRVGSIEPSSALKGKLDQKDTHHLTQDDLTSIFGLLSERQIEVARTLQEYLNTTCAEWGNEISMARFGYRQFTEQNYYPINVDRNNMPMADPQARETDLLRLLNMSPTKALTPNANSSVIINSIFDVFSVHTADMAKYNGLALPILDLLKWYNYKDKRYKDVTDSLGNITTQMSAESVQSVMEGAFGRMANNYVTNFVKDLNGVREGGRNEELLKGIVGKYKAAAVGANLRVAIQQPTSIARAAYVIDPKYLARGLAMKGGIQEAMENSGLAVWKSLGYFDTNIARNMREQIKHTESLTDKITDKSMSLAELGDKMTWGAIWNAAKLEMKETRRLSGDALLKATQERFDEIILATQVMDSTISRSDLMRNQSLAVSEVTSFRSEPTVTYNMMLDSMMDYNLELRKTKSASTAFRRTGKKMARAAAVHIASAALTAAAAAILDAMRDDDDYQTAVEKWLEHFWDNFLDNLNPLNLLPIIGQVIDIAVTGESPDSMIWQSLTQLRKALDSGKNLWDALFKKDPEATSRYTIWGELYKVMQGLSSISGLPVSGAYRDLKALWNSSGALLFPDKKIKFYDSGVKNQIKYGIQDGYLTEEEAIAILVDSGEVSDPDDAYWLTQEWLHADDSEWTRYGELHAAILAGDKKAFNSAQEALDDHGVTAYSSRIEAKNQIGRLYRGDDGKGSRLTEKQVVSYLKEFAGLGELEARHLKDEWDLQKLHGLKISEIGDAYVSGQITRKTATDYYMRFGHYYSQGVKKTLSELDFEKETGIKFSQMNDAYIHNEITERQAQNYLMKYGGLSQTEADAKILQWDLAKDYGIKYGSGDEGIKAALIEDYIDQETAITIMETYGGKTHEEAEDYSYQYLFTKETGYNFANIQEAFADEVIDEETMAYWYRVGSIYTHGSEEKAWEYAEVARWKAEVPGAERMNRTGLDKWEQRESKLRAQGLGEEDFAKVWTLYSESEAEYDKYGNQTKEKAQVFMEKLGQLRGYSKTQLTQLGYAVYSAKKVNAYKAW